jgi:hypothetical protein
MACFAISMITRQLGIIGDTDQLLSKLRTFREEKTQWLVRLLQSKTIGESFRRSSLLQMRPGPFFLALFFFPPSNDILRLPGS